MRHLHAILGGLALSLLVAAPVAATSCRDLPSTIDDARDLLRRAARAGDLDAGKDYARRARNALDDAAEAAQSCGCQQAYDEFDDASMYARRARDADDADEFVDLLRRSIQAFNEGINEVQACRARKR